MTSSRGRRQHLQADLRQRDGPEEDEQRLDRSEEPPVRPARQQGTQAQSPRLRNLIETVGVVAAPITIVSALAYYIGVVRQEEYVRHFGLNLSLLDFSNQDYVLRSVDALIRFLVWISLLMVVLLGAHLVFRGALQRCSNSASHAFALGITACGGAGVAVGAWLLLAHPVPLHGLYFIGPIALGVGAVLLAYGGQQLVRPSLLPGWAFSVAAVTIGALALIAVFWAANDYARVQGRSRALDLERAVRALPAAVVYSDAQLHLGAPGVQEDALTGEDGEVLYRYRGLQLLTRSGNKYFLLPATWTRQEGVVVVLPDSDSLRLEFSP